MSIDAASIPEFFKNQIEEAQRRQRLELLETTQFYLVNLLSEFLHAKKLYENMDGKTVDQPLAIIYGQALEAPTEAKKLALLRKIGDRSLYVSGFFSDSFKRKPIDIDYYISMGESAYGSVSDLAKDRATEAKFSEVFTELASKFKSLVDVIGEISESSRITSDKDLLRLYERWIHTKSKRLSNVLRKKGIITIEDSTENLH